MCIFKDYIKSCINHNNPKIIRTIKIIKKTKKNLFDLQIVYNE